MRRALKPGGRLGIACWADLSQCGFFADLVESLRHCGLDDIAALMEVPWSFPDAKKLADLLRAAGFSDLRIETRSLGMVFEGGIDQLFAAVTTATPVASLLPAAPEKQRNAFERAFRKRAAAHRRGDSLEAHMVSNLAIALR